MAKKILITGADGQLGEALKRKLSDQLHVFPTSRTSNKSESRHNILNLDITERSDVEKTINEIKPDIIINCAAYTDVDGNETNKKKAHMVNVVGLQNLIHASDRDTYIIQISSDYVFDGNNGPYKEGDHTFPLNYYGKTKLEAENILRGSQLKYLIIRTNVLYSEDLICKGNFFAWVYKSLNNNKAISVVNDQISNPTYVLHLADVIFQCLILNTQGIYHYGSDNYLSRYEFAMSIAEYFEFNKNLIKSIDTEQLTKNIPTYIAKRPKHSGLKIFKIEDELGLTAYSMDYSLSILKNSIVAA